MVRRREFIAGLGTAAAWPLAARAQQPALPVVAVVHPGSADSDAGYLATFRKGLGETGYVEGRNVTVEYHWLEGRYDQVPAVMADLVRRRVAVIVAFGRAWSAAKAATATIPIVFTTFSDPVKLGLVASLARPGGNATGSEVFVLELNGKRLGLLHDLLPKAVRVAVLVDPISGVPELQEAVRNSVAQVQEAARILGLQLQIFHASTIGEIDAVFAALARDLPDALLVIGSTFFGTRRAQLVTLTAYHRIPAAYPDRDSVAAGGLMSYDSDFAEGDRLSGIYVGRILKGEKPADLPVQRPTKFRFIINLKTARALGIEVPPQLLAITDEVIE
jgi:putative ABC transport system substrate-binding protein